MTTLAATIEGASTALRTAPRWSSSTSAAGATPFQVQLDGTWRRVYKEDGAIYAEAYLHGNHIATHHSNGEKKVNIPTLAYWPTATTRSRLRALGFDVYQKDHVTYLGDVAVA